VAAELLLEANPEVRVWVPTPTWANHVPLIGAAGINLVAYPYYDHDTATVDRDGLFTALDGLEAGDVVLVHATCHNPTGADLSVDDFRTLAEIALAKGTPVLVDSAYQGFAAGLEADAEGARVLVEAGLEVLISTSFSKNFGLYRDRAGALTVCGPSSRNVGAAFSNALRLVRMMYSTPPDHGPAAVARILAAQGLRSRWVSELEHMRTRLVSLRRTLVGALSARGADRYTPIADQRGMFSLLGIDEDTARRLTDDYHIYLPTNGRINVAGISDANVDYVADAIVAVTSDQSSTR
jgi:aspartate aminotransferase